LKRVVLNEAELVPKEPWAVSEVKLIRMGTTSSIFRAEICRGNDQPLDVALKIDPTGKWEEDFIREAVQYETGAKELQGIIFPHFHGCFQAEIGPTRVTCLVTEYCGEPMEQSLDVIDNPFL
jgi:hypothetical protein